MLTDWSVVAAVLGAGIGAGVIWLLVAVRGSTQPRTPRGRRVAALRAVMAPEVSDTAGRSRRSRVLIAAGVGVLVWVLSGWPVAAIASAGAVGLAPVIFSSGRSDKRRIERFEALEDWVRRIASTYASGAGLSAALIGAQQQAQPAIRPHVRALAARLSARMDPREALLAFADDLDDPVGDLVAAALIQVIGLHGSGSVGVLSALADTIAEDVLAARRIETERAQPRMTARIVIGVSVGMGVGMGVFTDYLRPYGTAEGQIVLGVVVLLAAGCVLWMHLKTLPPPEPRFLRDAQPGRWRS